MRRSNVLVAAGIAFFVVGVVIVALLGRDNGNSSSSNGNTVDVLVAKEDIAAGTNGNDAISKVEVRRINATDRKSDALTTPSQLSNQLFTSTFSKGEQIYSGGLKVRSIATPIQVPDGKEAVAVSVSFVGGGAGYLAPGDLVNVYQVIPNTIQGVENIDAPRTKLLLTNVRVLDVPQQVAPLSTSSNGSTSSSGQTGVVSRPTTNGGAFLLALDSIDAEKVIFGSATEGLELYLTRVNDNAAPSGPTTGRDLQNMLEESPEAANQRDHP